MPWMVDLYRLISWIISPIIAGMVQGFSTEISYRYKPQEGLACSLKVVIPAQAGIRSVGNLYKTIASRFHSQDRKRTSDNFLHQLRTAFSHHSSGGGPP